MADDLPPAPRPPTYEYARQEGKRVQSELAERARDASMYWPDYARGAIEDVRRTVRRAPEEIRTLRRYTREANRTAAGYRRGASSSGVPELRSKKRSSRRK